MVCASQDTNMTLAAFVYTRTADVEASATDVTGECPLPGEEGLLVRNSINYKPDSGEFFYYDDWIGAVMSKPEYCCNKWHYVGVSIEEDGSSKLMVDGGSPRLAVRTRTLSPPPSALKGEPLKRKTHTEGASKN
jgi:hypothetical protein